MLRGMLCFQLHKPQSQNNSNNVIRVDLNTYCLLPAIYRKPLGHWIDYDLRRGRFEVAAEKSQRTLLVEPISSDFGRYIDNGHELE